jgi:recombination associated protein RdgC
MLKSERICGYVDLKEKVLGIDTARDSAAERFIRRLQASVDGLNVRPLQFMKPVDELLTGIFFGGAPQQFALGRECRMRDPGETSSVVRWTDFDLSDPAIRNHVANGMQLTHLAIEYDNIMSCVLDQNGVISKLRFIGMDDDTDDENDPLARMDAEFVLLTGTLRRFLADLEKQLGGVA